MAAKTPRQEAWIAAANRSEPPASTLFALLALPNDSERGHVCAEHAVGFSRSGRRGFKCGVDGRIVRWVDADA